MELGSVPEWIGLVLAVFASGAAGGRYGAVRRMRLEDRRRILDDFVPQLRAGPSQAAPMSFELPEVRTPHADVVEKWRDLVYFTLALDGVADAVVFLPWVDRALWLDLRDAMKPEPSRRDRQALRIVNDSVYGLQAGLFVRDITKIQKAWDELEVGGVIIGDVPSWRVDHMPYGGVKNSGLGREGIRFAVEDMTEIRLLAIRNAGK